MKTRVRVSAQVEGLVKSLAPDPRKRLRQAIKDLAADRGDIQPLEGKLADYSRLRVAAYRVIFTSRAERGVRVIDCIYAERRSVVYEVFLQLLVEQAMR